jgi:hypothetical protein
VTEPSHSRGLLPAVGSATLVVVASAILAYSFGFNFGLGNHTAYLLPALKLLDPDLFVRDWALSSSTQYHQAFAYVAAPLLAADPQGWALAFALTASVMVGALALQALSSTLVGPRLGIPSFILLVSVLLLTRTTGPGGSYAFDGTFQPSAVSSVCLLAAVAAFVAGNRLVSGMLLALAALFHANLALLAFGAFGVAELALGRKDLGRRLLSQLVPASLIVGTFLPMLVEAASGGRDAALGRHVYLYVRAPHHFVLGDKIPEFFPLVGWSLVALAIVRPWLQTDHGIAFRRFAACVFGLLAVVGLGVLAAPLSDGARALFSWRMAPTAEIVLQAGSLAGVSRIVTEPRHSGAFGWQRVLVIGVGLSLVFVGWAAGDRLGPIQVVALITAGAVSSVLFDRWRTRARPAGVAGDARVRSRVLTAVSLLLLAGFALRPLARVPRYSNLMSGTQTAERKLFQWMQQGTRKSALFLIPPDLEGTRVFANRAVVVDWKNNPGIPSEVREWYRRLEDVTGRPGFRTVAALRGYDELDPGRLERLRARYGFDYAVVRRGREHAFAEYDRPYQNAEFVVLGSARR